jgi:hypothetical protein
MERPRLRHWSGWPETKTHRCDSLILLTEIFECEFRTRSPHDERSQPRSLPFIGKDGARVAFSRTGGRNYRNCNELLLYFA